MGRVCPIFSCVCTVMYMSNIPANYIHRYMAPPSRVYSLLYILSLHNSTGHTHRFYYDIRGVAALLPAAPILRLFPSLVLTTSGTQVLLQSSLENPIPSPPPPPLVLLLFFSGEKWCPE